MKHASNLVLATVAAILILSPAIAAEPYGKWVRPSNGAEVSFFNCGGKLCGKVVSKGTSSAKVGTMIVGGAAKVGANEWKGSLLNPEDGKSYSGVITLVGADGLNLKGCALGVFCEGGDLAPSTVSRSDARASAAKGRKSLRLARKGSGAPSKA
jgi:uncharacterized protein (DUF2147 family)